MRTDEIVNHYNVLHHKKEIEEIINKIKNIGTRNFKPTKHFEIRVSDFIRGFDRDLVFETLPQSEKIKVINVRKLKGGDFGYDLYYELAPYQTLIITLCLETREIINSVLKYAKYHNFIRKDYTF